MDLLIEIKILIASFDQGVWIKLVIYDDSFRQYAYSDGGRARFIELFTLIQIVSIPRIAEVRQWCLFHRLHRIDGPAEICDNGDQCWYRNGKLHRDNGPARVYANGTLSWHHHGCLHRQGAPAYIAAFYSKWYYDNEPHRANGPALTLRDGSRFWYQHGIPHRDDGPAKIMANGTQEWWLNGKRVFR